MADSCDEFTSADNTDSESVVENRRRKTKQLAVTAMLKHGVERQAKRRVPDSSPPDTTPALPAVQLDDSTLRVLESMIKRCNASMVAAFEAKFESMERRIQVIEGEAHEKDQRIQQLEAQLQQQGELNQQLHKQVQAMDMNGRLDSLVLTCDDFKPRRRDEDISRMIVVTLNNRIRDLNISPSDLHAAHRLQKDDKVICKFVQRQVRDHIYDSRFEMSRHELDGDGRRIRDLKPCYITESLTDGNKVIYNELLQARRPQNGSLVASVFTRRGVVYCRTVKGGNNIRVPDQSSLRRVLGGAHFALPSGRGDRSGPARRSPPQSDSLGAPLLRPSARPGGGGGGRSSGVARHAAPLPQSAPAGRGAGVGAAGGSGSADAGHPAPGSGDGAVSAQPSGADGSSNA